MWGRLHSRHFANNPVGIRVTTKFPAGFVRVSVFLLRLYCVAFIPIHPHQLFARLRLQGKLFSSLFVSANKHFSKMKPVFCGNFEYDAQPSDLKRLFSRYGRVDRVDMKSGFAFIYMDDERDAADAIRGLDNTEFGRQGRRLCVEWTKQERGIRRSEGGRRSSANSRPAKTLFVINFDPINTRVSDLERHFEPYGKLLNVRIRKNFAFVQYESQEEATRALDSTNMSKVLDRVISVEYAVREDGDRRGGRASPVRRGGYGRPAERESRDRGRSISPIYGRRRERGSPDYGRTGSPNYDRRPERGSPDYGRAASPVYARYRSRSPARR